MNMLGCSIVVILTTFHLYCMYHMMIINASTCSCQMEVVRQQQREFKNEAVPVPRPPPLENEVASGADSSEEESAEANSAEADTSRYYVTPRASSNVRNYGQKPRVSTKHALSITRLKRQVHTPIIVVGMMKAGTTSIFGYFRCGLRKEDESFISHYDCKPNIHNRANIRMTCGRRMFHNLERRQEAFDGMDNFAVYSEIDAQIDGAPHMFLPQYSYLHQIHKQYPRATFILNMRDPKSWIKSIDNWKDLRQKFIDIDLEDFKAGKGETDEELEEFYLLQAQKVRDFVKVFSSHELIEIDIVGEETGQIMQDSFGITKDCWGIRNSNPNGKAEWKMLPDHMVQEKEAAKAA